MYKESNPGIEHTGGGPQSLFRGPYLRPDYDYRYHVAAELSRDLETIQEAHWPTPPYSLRDLRRDFTFFGGCILVGFIPLLGFIGFAYIMSLLGC
jgi:hypothetical protein